MNSNLKIVLFSCLVMTTLINLTSQSKRIPSGVSRHKIKYIKLDGGIDDKMWKDRARNLSRSWNKERRLSDSEEQRAALEKKKS